MGEAVAELRVAAAQLQSFVHVKVQSGPLLGGGGGAHTQSLAVARGAAAKAEGSSKPPVTLRDFHQLKVRALATARAASRWPDRGW